MISYTPSSLRSVGGQSRGLSASRTSAVSIIVMQLTAICASQRTTALGKCQPACKPGSVGPPEGGATAIHLERPSPDASRDRPGRLAWKRPGHLPEGKGARAVPSWSCSRWGLPCRPRCRVRGGLLPHPFTLPRLLASRLATRASPLGARLRQVRTYEGGRFAFCGTFPGVAPAGHYPAPFFHGARTFLPACGEAAVRPAGALNVAMSGGAVKAGEGLRLMPRAV
jgi:hypothetical protein